MNGSDHADDTSLPPELANAVGVGPTLWDELFAKSPYGMILFRAVESADGGLDDFAWVAINPAAEAAFGLSCGGLRGSLLRERHPEGIDPRLYRRMVVAHVSSATQEFEQAYPRCEHGAQSAPPAELIQGVRPLADDKVDWYTVSIVPLGGGHLMAQFRSITHYKRVLRQAVELMNRDDLTGLANRRHVRSRFWVHRSTSTPMAFLYFDLNGFKAINDTYGHEVGDQVLSVVGRRLADNVRPGETVARLGGDEFAVLLAGPDLGAVARVTERLVSAIEEPISLNAGVVQLSASVGASTYPDDADSFEALVSKADERMYEQKRQQGHGR